MFDSDLRIVPWKNRAEFLSVYNDAYSDNTERQIKACQTMEMWLVLRNDVPPGVESTLNILSVLHQENRSSRQLQLTLSTAVLRVVNMLCDNARQSGKETIYSIAKYYNLPDWVVNLRHDVSHGTVLPDVSALKQAGKFLLTWLREYYWEVEKDNLNDIILNRSRYEACTENAEFYINSYIELMEFKLQLGDVKIKTIMKGDLLLKLIDINKRRGLNCAIECIPWVIHPRDKFAKEIPQESIPSMRIKPFVHLLLLQLQDYITKSSFWQVDVLPFIVNAMCRHFEKYKNINQEIWNTLLDKLNDWQVLDKVLEILAKQLYLENNATTEWFKEIYRSIVKRCFVDKLRVTLSSSAKLSNIPEEQAMIRERMLRKRLNLDAEASNNDVQKKLVTKIEKKYAILRDAISLSSSVQYIVDSCSVINTIQALVLHPTEHTISHITLLFDIVNPELPKSKIQDICDLVLVRLGQKTFKKLSNLNKYQAKTILDLNNYENDLSLKNQLVEQAEFLSRRKENVELLSLEEGNDLAQFTFSHPKIVRSGWDFNKCPLGVTPWEMNSEDYCHKELNPQNSVPCRIFPISN